MFEHADFVSLGIGGGRLWLLMKFSHRVENHGTTCCFNNHYTLPSSGMW
jgi:hypothetical protein